jgi:hypothetical protein
MLPDKPALPRQARRRGANSGECGGSIPLASLPRALIGRSTVQALEAHGRCVVWRVRDHGLQRWEQDSKDALASPLG